MTDQGDHARDRVLSECAAERRSCRSGAERLLADRARVALALLTMDANVACTNLPPCGTVHIRAKCRLRIDDTPPFALSTEECHSIRSFFSSPTPRPPFSVHLPSVAETTKRVQTRCLHRRNLLYHSCIPGIEFIPSRRTHAAPPIHPCRPCGRALLALACSCWRSRWPTPRQLRRVFG